MMSRARSKSSVNHCLQRTFSRQFCHRFFRSARCNDTSQNIEPKICEFNATKRDTM
jgi:hypothetical protein